ncbi:MAG: TnsA endonuclease N-terminal domain-containing protein [Mobilitalea sp.]
MPRRKNNLTKKKIAKWIKEGRGQGEKEKYIPWLQIGDFSSLGRGNRVNVPNNKRVHHFHSDLERDYFFYTIWNDDVDDLREQYPLRPAKEIISIAKELGYKPPKRYDSGCDYIMSTDMFVTIKMYNVKVEKAYSVKYKMELKKRRVLEKLAIEETYWGYRDVPYEIVTEDSFNRMAARNISFLFSHAILKPEISEEVIDHIYNELVDAIFYYKDKGVRLCEICKGIDVKNGYEMGFTLRFFYYYSALKDIAVKLERLIVGTSIIDEVVDYETFGNMMRGEMVNGDIM